MGLAGEERERMRITPEELNSQMQDLSAKFRKGREAVLKSQNLAPEHDQALSKLAGKLTPDMRIIANRMGVDYKPAARASGESIMDFIVNWIDGSQKTMNQALSAYSQVDNLNPAAYLTLQAAVQRASERAELFGSIVSSSVSGVKTIMSMQLG